ncbi:MAG: SAM-dependent methyltransferase [Thermoplasmata archaeon]|nr:SAM-dependent methyltransferase [Thermoplasmata archaeon]
MPESLPGSREPSPELLTRLRRLADPDGFLPFDRYWEVVQFSQGVGYFEQASSPLGPGGDYYTAPSVTPLFGATLADQLLAYWHGLGRPAQFRFVELGAGDGTLAAELLDRLGEARPERAAWEYAIVERSDTLRQAAVERLRPVAERAGIEFAAPEVLGSEGPFRGVVLANELLDTLPARRLRRNEEGWEELGVVVDQGRATPASRPLARPVPLPQLPACPIGATLEFSPEAEGLLREVADHLEAGAALFLDYGAAESRWSSVPGDGTLVALRQHAVLADPLEAPGRCDLSCFVNFTRVRAAAVRAGLREREFRPQREALVAWGFVERLERALQAAPSEADRVRLRLLGKNLLLGFENFHVLELEATGEDLPPGA